MARLIIIYTLHPTSLSYILLLCMCLCLRTPGHQRDPVARDRRHDRDFDVDGTHQYRIDDRVEVQYSNNGTLCHSPSPLILALITVMYVHTQLYWLISHQVITPRRLPKWTGTALIMLFSLMILPDHSITTDTFLKIWWEWTPTKFLPRWTSMTGRTSRDVVRHTWWYVCKCCVSVKWWYTLNA